MSTQLDIDYIAQLARIALSDEEKKRFSEQLGTIIDYVQQIQQVDVEGVEPMAHAFSIYNVYRPDEAGPTLTPEEVLMNAPVLPSGKKASRENQLIVPKVVE